MVLSIIELSVFLYHTLDLANSYGLEVTSQGPSPLCSALIYDPFRRYEVIKILRPAKAHLVFAQKSTIYLLLIGF